MSRIILRQSTIDKLMSDPKIQQGRQDKSGRQVPFLGYYRQSYSTAHDGTTTGYGDGFVLTTIDPDDRDETRDIVINFAAVASDFHLLMGGDEAIMSRRFAIGWSKTFTYEPEPTS